MKAMPRGMTTAMRIADRSRIRLGVAGSVIVNLALLGYFKYANFVVEQLNALGQRFGFEEIAWTGVVLPIGISFFTFQSMSYTIDVARGRVSHLRNPFDFALYVTLFPQLVAGPIVRFHEISDQLQQRETSVERFALGATRFAHGLAKKVLIADSVAPVADAAFGHSVELRVRHHGPAGVEDFAVFAVGIHDCDAATGPRKGNPLAVLFKDGGQCKSDIIAFGKI